MRPLIALAVLTLCLPGIAGCVTDRGSPDARLADMLPTRTEAQRAWRLVDGGDLLGYVVHYRAAAPIEAGFFSVRNSRQQELGMLDSLGRIWRFVPHATEARWLGTGTVLEGARRILDGGPECALEEVGFEELSDRAGT